MKQRLQKLVVLGLAVATVAGSSVPAYAAEIVPNANVEATAEVPTTEEEVTPKDEQKPEGENGEENPNEDTQAPTVQASATWNGSGDVVLQFNPNGLTAKDFDYSHYGVVGVGADGEVGFDYEGVDPIIDYEAGTVTITESMMREFMDFWSECRGGEAFTTGRIEVELFFVTQDGTEYEFFPDVNITDAGETNPDGGEQKPDGDEAKADITIPSTWDGDLELKVDGVDLSKVELVYFHGVFQEGVPYDAGIRIGKENINVEKGTIVFPESILADAIKRQNEKLEALGMDKLGATVEFTIDDVYATLEDGNVVFFKDVAGKSLQCKNPLFKGEQKPGEGGNQQGGDQKPNGDGNNNGDSHKPSVKPQTKPEVKPQKDDTTTTPKTGDPSAVAGLLGTSIGSLGVALMAFKRRFRK